MVIAPAQEIAPLIKTQRLPPFHVPLVERGPETVQFRHAIPLQSGHGRFRRAIPLPGDQGQKGGLALTGVDGQPLQTQRRRQPGGMTFRHLPAGILQGGQHALRGGAQLKRRLERGMQTIMGRRFCQGCPKTMFPPRRSHGAARQAAAVPAVPAEQRSHQTVQWLVLVGGVVESVTGGHLTAPSCADAGKAGRTGSPPAR